MDPYLTEFSATVFLATPPAGGWPERFAVVTACDPDGKKALQAANRKRTDSLRRMLLDAGIPVFPVTGCSRDFAHREQGYGCEVAYREGAVALGRQFKQLAVFWIERDTLELVYVVSGRRYKLGSWSARVKGSAVHA